MNTRPTPFVYHLYYWLSSFCFSVYIQNHFQIFICLLKTICLCFSYTLFCILSCSIKKYQRIVNRTYYWSIVDQANFLHVLRGRHSLPLLSSIARSMASWSIVASMYVEKVSLNILGHTRPVPLIGLNLFN
jgi:hypothetical protein